MFRCSQLLSGQKHIIKCVLPSKLSLTNLLFFTVSLVQEIDFSSLDCFFGFFFLVGKLGSCLIVPGLSLGHLREVRSW